MITVTPNAHAKLNQYLQNEPVGTCIRLYLSGVG